LISDAITVWMRNQRAGGRTDAQIAADLAEFDGWDRYDYDADGDFNEPDGYLDHFQVVYAGQSQSDGDPLRGEDSIWAHRWAAFQNVAGGPAFNPLGGTQIGTTGLWIREYTMQPENGGLGVFVHEYAHDLGIPDLYDSASTTANGEDALRWWTIMAQTRFSLPADQTVASRAGDFGPWEKYLLGWLSYTVVAAGTDRTVDLGPSEYNSAKPQSLIVTLPDKVVETTQAAAPEGKQQLWSGSGNNAERTYQRTVSLPARPATLRFKARWEIEDCRRDACDSAYVEVDDGTGFVPIPGSITDPAKGNVIDGDSGGWRDAHFDLSRYAGKRIALRFRYVSDGAVASPGLFLDDLQITAGRSTVFRENAEGRPAADPAATPTGTEFATIAATTSTSYTHYYIASNRTHVSYDQYLKTSPHRTGWDSARPNWVERFAYQEGLLLWYRDSSQVDNCTSQHPGTGRILPVDSRPALIEAVANWPWRPLVQTYDAPFSLRRADSMTLHWGNAYTITGLPGVALFDDSQSYYAENLTRGIRYGVKVPHLGVKVQVLSQDGTSMRVRVFGTLVSK
ncbi:MAG: immune inhibitor A, partial [Micromonosporaceae bacterium]|nr:immune inhibitor A [Micromonosporaceae bacterium]